MTRLLFLLFFITAIAAGCGKGDKISGDEADLYGTWAKGPNPSDTLYFLRENNKNIMRYKTASSPSPQPSLGSEYYLRGDKLSLKNFWGSGTDLNTIYPVPSFKWKQRGQEFEVMGPQIYPHMSAMMIVTFHKVP